MVNEQKLYKIQLEFSVFMFEQVLRYDNKRNLLNNFS